MKKIIIFLASIILVLIILAFLSPNIIENIWDSRKIISYDKRQLIKKYITPFFMINQLEEQVEEKQKRINKILPQLESLFQKSQVDIEMKEDDDVKLSNNRTLKKKNLINGFYYGIFPVTNNIDPGSGYIDFYQDKLFLLSSRGVLAFTDNINDNLNFKQIEHNIDEFIGLEQFKKSKTLSVKDLFIKKDKIFISYTEEIKEDCWNTSIIYGNINYENIKFEKFFSNKKCIHSINNVDGEFTGHQSGGRIVNFDNNHILLTVGEYRSRYLAQEIESINGKILKININDSSYQIISMGHRNNQGLYFDQENNFLLATEHGPEGGDEINLIEVNKINSDNPLNFGWPIVSAGEHYKGKTKQNEKKYKKYPLFKSHTEHGFIEPLISFVPSIGISEISKINKNIYVASSLRDRSLYFFELNIEKKLVNLERVEVFERVRDIFFKDDKLYLFLEDTNSIGIIFFD
jgi:hypothetical protein|tara:strand:+ start:1046 stop:2428 length:1383 start_codon:yes stop_codon:yes gene_type:complete